MPGWLRKILAVVTGIVVILMLVSVFDLIGGYFLFNSMPNPVTKQVPEDANTVGMCLWNMAWYFPSALLGGFLAVKVAGKRPAVPIAILAALMAVMGLALIFTGKEMYAGYGVDIPQWYFLALPVIGLCGLAGGFALATRCCKGSRAEEQAAA